VERTLPLHAVMVPWARARAKASGVMVPMVRVRAKKGHTRAPNSREFTVTPADHAKTHVFLDVFGTYLGWSKHL